ncbi:MAG: phosphate transport system regulatory protein PhoU [Nitrospirae bacterium CG_4_10_14_0_8_um_filter_41_23]|nr:phosphate signaling complex protein PhoU [Nitrospirota bacterium]PIQ93065.1 MAG: phosphate transport system regulatory protein PhoU [Nitrospirae bacterium CG11_big_fil_rev_8_21_14_0_20_41_14]PIV43990.1 MAG: phosphate transport system regulatory protein PhoU [Nitrospirae bacterium CG02_land_8_20_14_3_00_41_53]PIW86735.1 MAG: phosphate transport system regulatory protein PhoU [Nitrospirae bacterium CG_4_8_14_3_um_filter_41_47]PIY86744.1 MAG: phosphate transport system regulatory protein PhoU [
MAIFDEELKALREKVLKLGYMVEDAIRDSVKSLVERDSALAREVIKGDHLINALEVKIDEECIRLIALRQPVARDLRFITTTMKITTDLERMGDLAENICERALELNEKPQLKPFVNIPRMAEITQSMVRDALDAFVTGCSQLPYEVIKRDDEVDDLTVRNFEELLPLMIQDSKIIPLALKRTYVAKYLERIADHATNIAEMVIYMCKGKLIRHMEISE